MPVQLSSELEQDLIGRLRLKDLQFIQRISELKSLSATASELNMTQPAASRWLREVEQLFRAHLFTRDRMVGMTTTPLGELVLERARALLADVATLSVQVQAHREGRGGHLRLGAIPYVSARLLEKLISALLQQHAMTVSLVEAATEPLMESLRMEQLHAIIGRFTVRPLRQGLRQEELFTQKACLLVHENNGLGHKRQAKLADFSGLRWILPPRDSPTARAIAAACAAAKQTQPQAVLETASTKLIHAMVSANTDMVAVLPLDIGTDLERLSGVVVLPFPASFHLPPVGLIAPQRQWDQSHLVVLRRTLRGLVAAGSWA